MSDVNSYQFYKHCSPKTRHLEVEYVLCFEAKFFDAATLMVVTINPGNLKPNNVSISSEFNGTGLLL